MSLPTPRPWIKKAFIIVHGLGELSEIHKDFTFCRLPVNNDTLFFRGYFFAALDALVHAACEHKNDCNRRNENRNRTSFLCCIANDDTNWFENGVTLSLV